MGMPRVVSWACRLAWFVMSGACQTLPCRVAGASALCPADDTLGETCDSDAANRPDGGAIDAELQGERRSARASLPACARHPCTSPVVEADSVSDPQREQGLRPY